MDNFHYNDITNADYLDYLMVKISVKCQNLAIYLSPTKYSTLTYSALKLFVSLQWSILLAGSLHHV